MVAVGRLRPVPDSTLWQDEAGNYYLDAEGTIPAQDELPFSRPPAEAQMYREMEDPEKWGRVWDRALLSDPYYQSLGYYGQAAADRPREEAMSRWGLGYIMPATGDFGGWAGGFGVPSLAAEEPTGTVRQFLESGISLWKRDDWINGMRAMRNIGLIPSAIDPSQFNAMGGAEILNQFDQHVASQSDNANLQTAYGRITTAQVDAIAFGVMGISTLPPKMKEAYVRQYYMEKSRIERAFPDLVTTPQNWIAYLAFSGWNLNGLGLPVEGQQFRDATKPIPPAPTNIPSAEGAKALVVADGAADPNKQATSIGESNETPGKSTVPDNTAASTTHIKTHQGQSGSIADFEPTVYGDEDRITETRRTRGELPSTDLLPGSFGGEDISTEIPMATRQYLTQKNLPFTQTGEPRYTPSTDLLPGAFGGDDASIAANIANIFDNAPIPENPKDINYVSPFTPVIPGIQDTSGYDHQLQGYTPFTGLPTVGSAPSEVYDLEGTQGLIGSIGETNIPKPTIWDSSLGTTSKDRIAKILNQSDSLPWGDQATREHLLATPPRPFSSLTPEQMGLFPGHVGEWTMSEYPTPYEEWTHPIPAEDRPEFDIASDVYQEQRKILGYPEGFQLQYDNPFAYAWQKGIQNPWSRTFGMDYPGRGW